MDTHVRSSVSGHLGRYLAQLSLIGLLLIPVVQAADDPLVMGVFPRRNAAQTVKLFTPLAQHLSVKLGREVKLVTAKDFDAFWKGVTERRYDIVHYNQYHYLRSSRSYRVIGYNEEFGLGQVAGALYVRKDSGINDVSQLRGRKIIFGGGEDAMMSYIAPRYLLQQAGLKNGDFESAFAVNPPNALIALYHKQADAAGGGDILIDLSIVKKNINTEELKLIAKTEPMLFLPWAVKLDMPDKLREDIRTALVELKASESGKQILKAAKMTGFSKAEDRDYDSVRKIVAAVYGEDGAP